MDGTNELARSEQQNALVLRTRLAQESLLNLPSFVYFLRTDSCYKCGYGWLEVECHC